MLLSILLFEHPKQTIRLTDKSLREELFTLRMNKFPRFYPKIIFHFSIHSSLNQT